MRFGIGYYPKHLIIHDDCYCGGKIGVRTKEEALKIIKALKNYFHLIFKEDPMTQEEATEFMKELENGHGRRRRT